jgi:hypothetical protein
MIINHIHTLRRSKTNRSDGPPCVTCPPGSVVLPVGGWRLLDQTLGGINVIDQNTFFLKENGLENRLYVIYVQIILACKKDKKPTNFVTPTKLKKKYF